MDTFKTKNNTVYHITDKQMIYNQFGNFKFQFCQEPTQIHIDDEYDHSDIVKIFTCDEMPITDLRMNPKFSSYLCKKFVDMFHTKDTFIADLQRTNNRYIPSITGFFDVSNGKISFKKEHSPMIKGIPVYDFKQI